MGVCDALGDCDALADDVAVAVPVGVDEPVALAVVPVELLAELLAVGDDVAVGVAVPDDVAVGVAVPDAEAEGELEGEADADGVGASHARPEKPGRQAHVRLLTLGAPCVGPPQIFWLELSIHTAPRTSHTSLMGSLGTPSVCSMPDATMTPAPSGAAMTAAARRCRHGASMSSHGPSADGATLIMLVATGFASGK